MPAERFVATLRVSGLGARLADFRERVRYLMVREIDAERYSEHHATGRLEYRFELERGIPFPAFASASAEFPEVRVEAEWVNPGLGLRGRAVIENGRLSEQSSEPLETGRLEFDIEIGAAGELLLAIACRRRQTRSHTDGGAGWIGYCASSDRHAWFAWEGALELMPTDSSLEAALLAELEDIAFEFADEWLWYDDAPETETALERRRYAQAGWPVRGANLKAARMAQLRDALPGNRYGNLSGEAARVREAVREAWLEKK
jgi:hypothetical protein